MMVKRILLVVSFLFLVGCNIEYNPTRVQHIKGSVFSATDTGYYTAELVLKPKKPVVGENQAHLIIHNYEAKDIPGLRISAVPRLPTKEITSPKAKVTDAGRGLYVLEDINFTEPGDWEIDLIIYGEFKTDSVVLKIPPVE